MVQRLTDVDRAAAIRDQLRALREGQFGGNLSAMARAFGVTPAYLSDVLLEKRGVGMKILRALAKHTGQSIAGLIGEIDPADLDDPYPARAEALSLVQRALDYVRRHHYPDAGGRSPEWWLLEVREAEARIRRGELLDEPEREPPLRSEIRRKREAR